MSELAALMMKQAIHACKQRYGRTDGDKRANGNDREGDQRMGDTQVIGLPPACAERHQFDERCNDVLPGIHVRSHSKEIARRIRRCCAVIDGPRKLENLQFRKTQRWGGHKLGGRGMLRLPIDEPTYGFPAGCRAQLFAGALHEFVDSVLGNIEAQGNLLGLMVAASREAQTIALTRGQTGNGFPLPIRYLG